jgi:hypothetical protein
MAHWGNRNVSVTAHRVADDGVFNVADDQHGTDDWLVFHACDFDGYSGEAQGILEGVGAVTESRSSQIYTQQADGTFAATAGSTLAVEHATDGKWFCSVPAATNACDASEPSAAAPGSWTNTQGWTDDGGAPSSIMTGRTAYTLTNPGVSASRSMPMTNVTAGDGRCCLSIRSAALASLAVSG